MKTLSIDLETFSDVDLAKCGVYKYCESPNFEILLFGYSVDGGDVQVVDLASGETLPQPIIDALTDDTVIKWAYNAQFERVCLSRYLVDLGVSLDPFLDNLSTSTELTRFLPPSSWRCSMVWAAYMWLPQSLEGVGAVLGLEKQKLTEGKDLIRYFCVPCKPTKANGGRTRNLPEHDMEKWKRFKAYNLRDVETEMQIQKKLSKFPVPDFVWEEYAHDQEINDTGIGVDMDMVTQAIALDARAKTELTTAMKELTELDNPNSVQQMKQWLAENGLETDSLDKKAVAGLLKTAPKPLKTVLTLRQQLAKSSVKKYTAMENAVCLDSRARGMFRFYGANRTGRFSGKIIQLQNLPQNHIPDLEQARELVKAGAFEALSMLYEDVPDTLSQLIRTAFVPQNGRKFIVADFSAIEARVIAWLAGEEWRLKVFEEGGDIYCASASQMFHVPVVKHGVNDHLRQKGKIAELALGYGGSVGALKAMGALEMGLSEDELKPLVDSWREANPNIVRLWWDVDRAVKESIRQRVTTETHGLKFQHKRGMLFITLPSERRLAYVKPRIGENVFGGESVTYMGIGGAKKWERLESYGPKFVENCVAAGTLVITQRGLITIEGITDTDLLWDGYEWCHHDGLIAKGRQTVVKVNGIYLTPEHQILTEKGWMECAKSGGFNWAAFSLPDGFDPCREHKTWQSPMVVPVRLRKAESYPCQKPYIKDKPCQVVWVYARAANLRGINTARHESSSRIRCVALHEAEMRGSETSCLSQLRQSGNHGLQGMERKLRGVLEGYGTDISARAGLRPNRQQRGISPRKLSVGHSENQREEQTDKSCDRYPIRQDDSICAGRTDGHRRNNTHIPSGSQLADRITVHGTGFQKPPVYDIRNCGPRHRFAVWDEEFEKVRIVSNCVQAISRDILCYAMQTLRHCSIVAHVHDEIIIEADRRMSLEAVCEQMGRTPPWAEGLLLRADGYECDFYRKD